jgi:hypothetical protein
MEAMKGDGHVASFIAHGPGKALFVGLYKIAGSKPLTFEEFWRVPAYIEMKAFGKKGWNAGEDARPSVLWFELQLTDFYARWKGKLVVGWPPPERSWWRRAHRKEHPVLAVLEDSALEAAMPEWDEPGLSWEELAVLPSRWRAALAQWRGGLPHLRRLAMTLEDSWGGDVVTAAVAHLAHSTPPELLFTATDFNSYVTVSTAEGAPRREHGRLAAPTAPGLGAEPRMDVPGQPVVVVG